MPQAFHQILQKATEEMGPCKNIMFDLAKVAPKGSHIEYVEVFSKAGQTSTLMQGDKVVSYGTHWVIKVDNIVYDAFNKLGIPWDTYQKLLETARPGTVYFIPHDKPPAL